MQTLASSIVIAAICGHRGGVPGGLIKILLPAVVMISLILALGLVLFLARRKFFESNADNIPGSGTGFDIEQVEVLRDKGKISNAEFQSLRQGALGLDSSAEKKDNPSLTKAVNQDD